MIGPLSVDDARAFVRIICRNGGPSRPPGYPKADEVRVTVNPLLPHTLEVSARGYTREVDGRDPERAVDRIQNFLYALAEQAADP